MNDTGDPTPEESLESFKDRVQSEIERLINTHPNESVQRALMVLRSRIFKNP